ncbi:hypothetical protein M2302_005105 [Micromonospora sp. A200]|uniref:hypothetical protein n=1 Tax=Micromonospora sp. A200 TaxID=2940568 RepID=UPI0024737623|nr:hypothetical protein [Micromonospora sp. A200]MDH6464904.1 hypothetical protein [Micromonospora sp. A200]
MRDVPEATPPVTLGVGDGRTDAGRPAPAEAADDPGPTPVGYRRDTPFLPRSSRSRRI